MLRGVEIGDWNAEPLCRSHIKRISNGFTTMLESIEGFDLGVGVSTFASTSTVHEIDLMMILREVLKRDEHVHGCSP